MGEKLMALIACVLVGGGFLVFGWINAIKVSVSRRWPQVTGTITRSSVQSNTDADTDPYAVSIEYHYVVNGVAYTGAQQMGSFIRQSSAQARAERYPVNSRVIVYFDPEQPANAVLEPGYTKVMLAIAGGVVFLLLGARLAFELTFR
jgi:hypothetical protein